ncbi:hypothetical protein M7784_11245 [Desulfovibrio aminophilus]|nr:hypothetical protein [Desulfovibrio aminophilus]MCM0755817.1 hypothetical protein [Desulfovibrio aminophilus]
MTQRGLFPSWLDGSLARDASFGRAYAAVPDARRALLKTAIARLWDWCAPAEALHRRAETLWRSGLRSVSLAEPRRFAMMLFDAGETSPSRLLAALVPALAAGVPDVLAVRLGGRALPPAPQLLALELAGVERLALLSRARCAELLAHLGQGGESGAVLALGREAASVVAEARLHSARQRAWTPGSGPAGVWLERGAGSDLEALDFAQQGAEIHVWGAGRRSIPGGFVRRSGTFETFLRQGYSALYVPEARREACAGRAPLVLGPGCESCWLWPDLEASLFTPRRVCWSVDG